MPHPPGDLGPCDARPLPRGPHFLAGARNKEIAEHLSLSLRTVRFHIDNTYQKLGARNRTGAVRAGIERGLVNI